MYVYKLTHNACLCTQPSDPHNLNKTMYNCVEKGKCFKRMKSDKLDAGLREVLVLFEQNKRKAKKKKTYATY